MKSQKKAAKPARSRKRPKSEASPATRGAQCEPRSGARYVVGVGASAGGLEALRALFSLLKPTDEMAFVVVQHLAPLYQSRLVELIAHSTPLKVKEARDAERPEPGVIYVTPPNKDIFIEKGQLRLRRPHLKIGPKPSVDSFFQSLAEDLGECAVGVILSGTGSDGALGIRAIKAGGGLTIAQRASSAKYDGMPKAAKLTGSVDMEMTPEQIAKELQSYQGIRKAVIEERAPATDDDKPYAKVLALLHREVGADFAQYKPATIQRRIERRMTATHSDTLADYYRLLDKSADEVRLLFQDILISVTSFFRDPEAFRALEKRLTELLRSKRAGGTVRFWIIGCATGEEAYSVAILAFEIGLRLKKQFTFQIFATDLDDQALAIARRGIYPKSSVSELPEEFRERYFQIVEDRFQIVPPVRDSVVFARHNVIQDPPFLSMDLVTCRNVLIYFGPELQERVFKTAHYALAKGGLLFLGKSENVSAALGLFEIDSKSAKLFTRVDRKAELPRSVPRRLQDALTRKADPAEAPHAVGTDLYTSMIASFAPDSVVVSEDNQIRFINGQAGQLLTLSPGDVTQNITKLLSPDLGLELTALLHRARRDNRLVRGGEHPRRFGRETRLVRMSVAPLTSASQREFLVAFDSREEPAPLPGAPLAAGASPGELSLAERLQRTEQDLSATQNHLQTIMEEQETSNEELQSLNEELQSSNEELQSSNEELETANEEMQSSNEELTTLNQELNVKSTELQTLNLTLQAIQNAIIYPIIIVDKGLRLLNFNPAARYLLRISENDVGHTLKAIPSHLNLGKLITLVEKAIRGDGETSTQLRGQDRSFEVQIQVYRGARDAVEGVVVSFVDNTEIMTALESARLIKGRLSDIMDNTPAMVTMKDTMGIYTYANRRFAQLVRSTPEDVLGQADDELLGPEQAKQLRDRDFEVAKLRAPIQSEEKVTVEGHPYWWASARFPLLDPKNRVQSVCTISLDITERVLHRRQLELFKQAVSSATGGIMLLEESGTEDFLTTFVSDELGETIGCKSDALRGVGIRDVLKRLFGAGGGRKAPAGRTKRIDEVLARLRDPGPQVMTLGPIPRDGTEQWLELRSRRLEFKEEAGAHLVVTLFDVTQREMDQRTIIQQQDELTRFSRFSALGEIAAGIAHEINTPLNVVTTKTDYLKKLVQLKRLEPEKVLQASGDIDQMAKTISSIVIGLKSLASSQSDDFEEVNICQLVRDTLKVCEFRLHRFGVDLRLHLPDEDRKAECYPVQISQILINLVNNSVDAIADLPERWINVDLFEREEQVVIVVTDCGHGIASDLAEKIMTPFFTTKRENGTGIGLSLSRTIARRHGGDLVLDQGNKNTAFRLNLPKRRA